VLIGLPPAVAAGERPLAAAHEPDVVVDWIAQVYDLVRAEGLASPSGARVYAYVAIAAYEAVVDGLPGHRSLGDRLAGLPPAGRPRPRLDWPAAVNAAVAATAFGLLRAGGDLAEAAITIRAARVRAERIRAGIPFHVVEASEAHGRAVAARVLARAEHDGHAETIGRPYDPPLGSAAWQRTEPDFALAAAPYYGESVRPFVLSRADECAPAPPVPYAAEALHQQGLAVYEIGRALSGEQRRIARCWADEPKRSGLPAGHWLLIASQAVRAQRLHLGRACELYAWLGVSLADAQLACWHEKYRTGLLRPVTYVSRCIDRSWSPYLDTPASPSHVSGHAVAAAAAAEVLASLLGPVAAVDETHAALGLPVRSYPSFHAAAREVAASRVLAGVQFPMGVEHGLEMGERIGRVVVQRLQVLVEG
jgi:membrane-associated phospholipid phosphatase